MTDGFDLGLGTLMPFLGKTEADKRVMINAIGPLWDGNEVWLLTAGGVTFAAFPEVYAVMFSSLYSALMLILFALILRGVAFEDGGVLRVATQIGRHKTDRKRMAVLEQGGRHAISRFSLLEDLGAFGLMSCLSTNGRSWLSVEHPFFIFKC